jgi:hypothetical protein
LATIINFVSTKDMKVLKSLLGLFVVLVAAVHQPLIGEDYDNEPINYSSGSVEDPIARLSRRLASGEITLSWDEQYGYVPSLLQLLNISTSSQVLVFSKTSLQREFITPERPRAIYFNDEVYVGVVQHSEVVEIASVDPRQGTIFYVSKNRRENAQVQRQTQECLQCHDSNGFTGGVPGLMMRSVYPGYDGRPILTAGSYVTDHRSPLHLRWGGWYVTGTTGNLGHLGNQLFSSDIRPEIVDTARGSQRSTLAELIDTSLYLTPHSDVVALMVLGHQLQMHNVLTQASYEGRHAERDALVMNEALGRAPEFRSETFHRRITAVGEKLVQSLLYCEEAPLSGRVQGTSTFTADFQTRGPRDPLGRSLRDFDLERRLLRYPLSHLIYSESFDALPKPVLAYVHDRLLSILTSTAANDPCRHLSPVDRRAILEILVATKLGLPATYAAALTSGR